MRNFFSPAAGPSWLRQTMDSIRAALGDIWPAPLRLKDYATADLPTAADFGAGLVYDSTTGKVNYSNGATWAALSTTTGTVTSVSVVTANGVSGSVANPTTTPAITITLGAITPTSVTAAAGITNTAGTPGSTTYFNANIDNAGVGATNITGYRILEAGVSLGGFLGVRDGSNNQLRITIVGASSTFSVDINGTNVGRYSSTGLAIAGGVSATSFVRVDKDGSDTIASGPFFYLGNVAATKAWVFQLSASNNLDLWNFDGGWAKKLTINTSTGNASFAGTLGASNLSGTNTGDQSVPIVLFDHYADAGNVTTGETDLYSDTVSAGRLGANGAKLNAYYGGVYVSSATATRQIKIYFAGTAIFDTGALTLSLSAAWTAYVDIIRVSATVVRYMISFTTEGAALAAYTAVGELTGLTLSNTAVLKITGQAAGVGAATNDIVAKLASINYVPAA